MTSVNGICVSFAMISHTNAYAFIGLIAPLEDGDAQVITTMLGKGHKWIRERDNT